MKYPEEKREFIAGRNAVAEALKAGQTLNALYIAAGERQGSISHLVAMAREQGVVIKEVSPKKLDFLCGHMAHQGVVATISAAEYATVADILQRAADKGEKPFLLAADEIEDPHNLGALIRTAEAAGVHGVLIPKRRSVQLTAAVYKASAGALSYMPVARVQNLAGTLDELKKQGIWVYGADMDGQNWCSVDYTGGCCLVVGSEGQGIGRLIRDKCDVMVSLPMAGQVNSLNASVAGGILLYEIARQRQALPAYHPAGR
ncbi:MAG TPA: 23S rRNA (guanosine(2251)-2'-O)-methyltransferase RlmB [Firmicutes bacterium]|nr:23S rRNA (guanosine(2251)-2'-O)-methyltransferase RlmB [Bacillota bacterium]